MESEFLKGLGFRLGVEKSEYTHWRNLLDGFIYSRQQAAHHTSLSRHRPSWSPQPMIYTPTSMSIPQLPGQMQSRARSASPIPAFSPTEYLPIRSYNYGEPSPVHRKRTAVDAFATDVPTSTQYYEHMRLPVRKAQFGSMDAGTGFNVQTETSASGLARSSSLTRQQRQIARLPGEGGRRGSLGHIYGATTPAAESEVDLRHAAAMQWQNEEHGYASAQNHVPTTAWPGPSALITTYDGSAQPATVPPEVSRAILQVYIADSSTLCSTRSLRRRIPDTTARLERPFCAINTLQSRKRLCQPPRKPHTPPTLLTTPSPTPTRRTLFLRLTVTPSRNRPSSPMLVRPDTHTMPRRRCRPRVAHPLVWASQG